MNNLKNIKKLNKLNKNLIVLALGLTLSACGSSDDDVVDVIDDILNTAPTISSTAVTTVESGTAYSYSLVAADADSDTLTMSAANLPAWLTFDSATGSLSGTPAVSDAGDTAVTLTVSDGTDDITQAFTITVTLPVAVNNAAVITSTGVTSATVGEAYSYTLAATDADTDTLTMSTTIPGALSWLTFDDATGILSGIPATGDVAATEITLTVNDGTEDSVQTFIITVEEEADESTELLINGDFENSSTSWNDIGTIVAGDNNYFEADVQAAGNPWDVSLNQVITLVPNTTYTFSFKAKASVARTMIAGLGLNYDPWDSVTETVSLTTEWVNYTYTMTTTFGDENNRVIFDMGAEAGVVSIDDVSVTVDDTVIETPNAELLTNAGFDNGSENWNDVGTIVEGDNNYFEADVQAAGNPWDVSLNQVMTLVPNTTYTFSFKAKASVARTMIAGLGLNYDPWDSVTETVSLTTEWVNYTYTMTTTFGDENNRVIFDMGAEAGVVSIDDVSVTVDDTVIETPNAELLTNAGFDNGSENWNDVGTIVEGDNNYFEADVQAAGNPWDVSLNQVMTLVPNTTYTFSFKAKASVARTMIAGLGLNYDPWDSVTETVSLTTEWVNYTYTMTTTFGDENNRVIFDMGAEVGVVSIDDVSVKVSSDNGDGGEPATVVGIADIGDYGFVSNGGFEEGIAGWGEENSMISVEMDDLGTQLVKIIAPEAQNPSIKQSKIGEGTIIAGQALTVSFDMKGTTVGDGGVVNALLFTEASSGVSKTDVLMTSVPTEGWTSYSFDVTAGTDTEWGVALLLQPACGAVPGCKVTAYFDNVKIVANMM